MDRSLPWMDRLRIRFHLRACYLCARYHRQLLMLRALAHKHRDLEEPPIDAGLSDEARERIKKSLRPPGDR